MPSTSRTAALGQQLRPVNQATSQQEGEDVGDDDSHDTSPQNVVQLQNQKDGDLRIKGRIQLAHDLGPDIAPVNDAEAYASCTGCSTIAVALQIVLIGRDVQSYTPQNTAVAVNYQCHSCNTVADAYQYVIQVDDPEQVPDDVNGLIRSLDRKLRDISHQHSLTAQEAESQVDAVIVSFSGIAANFSKQRDEDTREPDRDSGPASPTPAAAVSSPAPAAVTPARSASSPTAAARSVTVTPSPTPIPTATPTPSATATPTPSPAPG